MAAALTRTDPLLAFQRMPHKRYPRLPVLLTFAMARRRRRGSVGRREERRRECRAERKKSKRDQDQNQDQDPEEDQDGLNGKEGQGSSKGR